MFEMSRKKGFSLIELVVTITILAVLLPKIMDPFFTIFVKGAKLDELSTAGMLAENTLEDLQGKAFAQVLTAGTSNFSSPYENYSFAVQVDYVNGPDYLDTTAGGATEYKRAYITVITPGNDSYRLTTLFTAHGFN